LHLRALSINDDEEIFSLRSNKDVNTFVKREPSKTIEDARIFINTILSSNKKNELFYWGIILKETDTLIGTICLANVLFETLTAEIGYELLPTFQNKGFIQESIIKVIDFGFEILQLNNIEANVDAANIKSIYILEKYGFVKDISSQKSNQENYIKYIKYR
jgi:ribosomal-protein-alanine N-acetyltransferase